MTVSKAISWLTLALATPRSWVRFPGKARNYKTVNVYLEMQCKSLWIKVSTNCMNVNVHGAIMVHVDSELASSEVLAGV